MLVITRGYPKISQNREQEKPWNLGMGIVDDLGMVEGEFQRNAQGLFQALGGRS